MVGFDEKAFYLEEFRARTLVVAVDAPELAAAVDRRRLAQVATDLVAAGARVVVVLGALAGGRSEATALLARLGLPAPRARLPRGLARSRGDTQGPVGFDRRDSFMVTAALWQVLRARPIGVVYTREAAARAACAIAARLRAHKLALVDPAGGLSDASNGSTFSFLDRSTLHVLLQEGEAEFQGLSARRTLLEAIDPVLEAGVGSINLCSLRGLPMELFTYEGSGTLFTRGDYCRVEPLSVDDFHEVERLIVRGQGEGLLKPRSPEEIGELLLTGVGAWLGTRHLAGVGALRTRGFEAERAGEVTGLYTITRFKGEGVGNRIVRRLVEQATVAGLDYVFATTTLDRAIEFFRREGFREVAAEAVPARKWEGYDPARRGRASVLRFDLPRTAGLSRGLARGKAGSAVP